MSEYKYNAMLTAKTSRSVNVVSTLMLLGAGYMVKLASFAHRTNTQIHLQGSPPRAYDWWEGFVIAATMIFVGLIGFWLARKAAREWREQERQRQIDAAS